MSPPECLLDVLPVPPASAERRHYRRFPSRQISLVRPLETVGTAARRARVRDVSAGGISLVLNFRYPPGTLLELSPVGLFFPRRLFGRVVYCSGEADQWVHGCELDRALGTAELERLTGVPLPRRGKVE